MSMYPANQGEIDKFTAGIIKSLHSKESRDQIVQQLLTEEVPLPARIASVAASVLTAMLQRVKQQTGRQPHQRLLVKAIAMTVREIGLIIQAIGGKVEQEVLAQAAEMVGDMLESGMGQQGQAQPQQPQQQQAQPPQGLIGGMA